MEGMTMNEFEVRTKIKLHDVLFEIIVTKMLSADPALRQTFATTLTDRIQVGPPSPDFHNGTAEVWTCDDDLRTAASRFAERVRANLQDAEDEAGD